MVGQRGRAHRRRLFGKLNGRSDGSIERKHQNISAVLVDLGLPYIDGYKPLRNYQRQILPDAVFELVAASRHLRDQLEQASMAEPAVPSVADILTILADTPRPAEVVPAENLYERAHASARPRVAFDYLRREAANAKLGLAGELLIMNFEKARLIHAGKETLAEGVEHTARTVGDSAGFDIRSYETSGHDRFIEAKTTRHGKETPFYVTRNELEVSRRNTDRYWLYRVYRYGSTPRLFVLNGALDERFVLKPYGYVATGVA